MNINKESIHINGFNLHYSIEGQGFPALVIGSSLYYPRTFSQNLRSKLQMVFVDHRGFVSSSDSIDPTKYTLDTLVEDIEKIRKKLNIERMIIIGHSGHGYMAQAYAKKYPAHVSHLVMIATGPDQSPKSHQAAEQYLQDSVCPERKAQLAKDLESLSAELAKHPDKRFIIFCLKLRARSWLDYTFDATPLWKDVYVNMPIIDHFWGTIFKDIDITQDVEKLTMPTLLALGRYDYLIAPPCSWDSIRSQFSNLTVCIFEQSSHTPQYEQSNDFDRELLEWLTRNNLIIL